VNRSPGRNGFQKRMRFTLLPRATRIRSRHTWLLDKKRLRTERSVRGPGLIFPGAEARLLFGEGSAKLRINQPPNHPGVISFTGKRGFSLSAAEIGGR
jgi:hypothetical protein